jgi:ATPase subunit of ABC transporter with duplicated ATPase domains
MSPKARQAKGKARVTAYERLLSQDFERYRDEQELPIPPGPRLGDVVIEVEGVAKGYGDRLLMDGLTLSIPPGSIVGVIGPNGAGKTTLLRMITGQEAPDAGRVRIGETVKIAYADQSRTLDPDKTVWEEISGGEDLIKVDGKEMNTRAYCASFGFGGADQQKKCGTLSGGERNRVHLAKAVSEGGNVLLLDEPTNDLDVNTLRALEDALEGFPGCAVVVSHDRWFLDRVATHILAFEDDGSTHWIFGNYSEYHEDLRRRKGAAADQPHRLKHRTLKR